MGPVAVGGSDSYGLLISTLIPDGIDSEESCGFFLYKLMVPPRAIKPFGIGDQVSLILMVSAISGTANVALPVWSSLIDGGVSGKCGTGVK